MAPEIAGGEGITELTDRHWQQGLVKVSVTVRDRRTGGSWRWAVLRRGACPGRVIERGFGGGLACDTGLRLSGCA
jgi:hypothetical protein